MRNTLPLLLRYRKYRYPVHEPHFVYKPMPNKEFYTKIGLMIGGICLGQGIFYYLLYTINKKNENKL